MSGHNRSSLDVDRHPESGLRSDECRSTDPRSAEVRSLGSPSDPNPKPKSAPRRISPSLTRSLGVAQAARDRLAESSYPALRALRLSFHEGVLTLRGRVPSYHMKQVAWKLVGELPGVEEFVDRLEVVEGPDEAGGETPDENAS
ncbi:MAG TPA: BON domain-containing protein [Pirellulales bacterium]|nr:BON domain-containing protein [Pirellulales bacterium]